ncbi:MAG: serine/threonine protein kinase [Acidobacteriota bacterium]|nr:serine/threonine protein kinase [Acidobacteriota bacterium]
MTPDRWDRIVSVFGEASELPCPDQSGFLDAQCGSDAALRGAVERLLSEHERGAGLLDRPLFSPPAAPDEDVWAGRVLNGRYRIERFLARGGMCTVYLGRDQQLAGRAVVVKFLHAWARQYGGLRSRFRGEMEALARIDHHAVVGVLDVGETGGGLPFLVIEYIDGVTLRTEMTRGPMALDRIARVIRETGRAVGAAHAKSVLHRDLKPENIMLERPGTPEERVRLIDFGIARVEDPTDFTPTQVTQFAGTTHYMAPEQLRGKPCAASDLYALAVVAWEMLAGGRPFSAASPVDLYEQQRAGVKAEVLVRRGVPETAARLIVEQLSFRVDSRGVSAAETAGQIADALLCPDERVWLRRRAMAGMAGGAAVLLCGGYAWWARQSGTVPAAERIVEWPPGAEPAEHGFQPRGAIENRAIFNSDATRVEALRLISADQGGYFHSLNPAQAKAANRHGWKLIFEAAAEEGGITAGVCVPHAPARYAVNITATPGAGDLVRLLQGFTPAIHGIDMTPGGASGARRRYLLAYQPGAGAELWVDGARLYRGFQGCTEYLYARGPEFGVARYRSARGSGIFWNCRFEIG